MVDFASLVPDQLLNVPLVMIFETKEVVGHLGVVPVVLVALWNVLKGLALGAVAALEDALALEAGVASGSVLAILKVIGTSLTVLKEV